MEKVFNQGAYHKTSQGRKESVYINEREYTVFYDRDALGEWQAFKEECQVDLNEGPQRHLRIGYFGLSH